MHQGQIAGTHWDPNQYSRFADHRLRPALELLGRVPIQSPHVIYDLGCGSGQVTRLIAARWPAATVCGLDNSQEMLGQAAAQSGTIQWIEADIRTWSPAANAAAPADLIYSNATLHWVEGHQALFPRLVSLLRPGGCLAVQMPLSWAAPSHRLMRETLADGGTGGNALGSAELRQAVARDWVEPAAVYYDLLAGLCRTLDIWETEYLQILEGEDPVLEWVKGTGLRPILASLGDLERDIFLKEYARRLRAAYPARARGRTLYPFRRLFIVATV
jgi:trans-aconitate 2-methyltransferase